MKQFLQAHWPKLALGLAGLLLAILLVVQATDYGRALLARHGLRKEQAQAETQRSISTAKSQARYQHYQLDSTARATQAQQQLHDIHLSQQRDAQIDSKRPARPELPAYGDLPRE